MKLEKALFYNSKKRILLLFSMLVFVMFALFLNLTFFFSKYRIQDTLQIETFPKQFSAMINIMKRMNYS